MVFSLKDLNGRFISRYIAYGISVLLADQPHNWPDCWPDAERALANRLRASATRFDQAV